MKNIKNNTMEIIKKLFSFKGKINRKKFFFVFLIIIIAAFIVAVINVSAVLFVFYIIVIPFHACNTVKRLHDLNRPGWHYWLSLIPIYNIYFAIVLFTRKGTVGDNTYGVNKSTSNLKKFYENKNNINNNNKTMYSNNKNTELIDVGALTIAIIFWGLVITGLWILMGGLISIT